VPAAAVLAERNFRLLFAARTISFFGTNLAPIAVALAVLAYNWLGAMAFLPAGYAIAGPAADLIGISTSLWIGAAWIVVTTAAVLCVPDVRNFRSAEASAEGAPVPVTP
jgi:hypothetical protein